VKPARWSPIALRPDLKARGWKAAAGWYPFDSRELRADTSVRYTKRECQTRCDRLNARAEGAK
jgi:hypothetical protein